MEGGREGGRHRGHCIEANSNIFMKRKEREREEEEEDRSHIISKRFIMNIISLHHICTCNTNMRVRMTNSFHSLSCLHTHYIKFDQNCPGGGKGGGIWIFAYSKEYKIVAMAIK